MDKTPLLVFTGIGLIGYVIFHGHQLGKDCWLCNYRGLAFMGGSLVLGTLITITD